MTPILTIAALWLALDVVLVLVWHAAHVIARRPATTTDRARPALGVALRTSYRFDLEGSWAERGPRVVTAGTRS